MKKIVSYSLYNKIPKNNINAIINCMLVPLVYAGWTIRFYVDDTIPPAIGELLRSFPHVDVRTMPTHRGSEAMLWRFLPAAEQDVVMISRDADSWVSMREKASVDAWLASDKNFHILRDHCYHSQKIMGGMWGVRNGILPKMKEEVEKFSIDKTYDQGFLAEVIYPNITHDLLVHHGEQYDNKHNFLPLGYFPEGGVVLPMPKYDEWDEPIPGLSFREVNKASGFMCCHCNKVHETFVGGIMDHIPPRAMAVVQAYAKSKNISLEGCL